MIPSAREAEEHAGTRVTVGRDGVVGGVEGSTIVVWVRVGTDVHRRRVQQAPQRDTQAGWHTVVHPYAVNPRASACLTVPQLHARIAMAAAWLQPLPPLGTVTHMQPGPSCSLACSRRRISSASLGWCTLGGRHGSAAVTWRWGANRRNRPCLRHPAIHSARGALRDRRRGGGV